MLKRLRKFFRILSLHCERYYHQVDAEFALNRGDNVFAADCLLRATRCGMALQKLEFLGHE